MPYIDSTEAFPTDLQELYPTADGKRVHVNTYTIDNQEVDVDFTVFYSIPADKVGYVFTNNRDYAQRLYTMVLDRLKVVMGQINVQSVAEKRGELHNRITAMLKKDAETLGLLVSDVQLTDLQYTESFRQAINSAAVAKAGIEKIEYEKQQASKTAETVKIKAEGSANAVRADAAGQADARALSALGEAKAIEAQGQANANVRLLTARAEAQAIRLQGEAQADAIKAQGIALHDNPNIIELRKAERWSGNLPVNVYGSAPIPFLNLAPQR